MGDFAFVLLLLVGLLVLLIYRAVRRRRETRATRDKVAELASTVSRLEAQVADLAGLASRVYSLEQGRPEGSVPGSTERAAEPPPVVALGPPADYPFVEHEEAPIAGSVIPPIAPGLPAEIPGPTDHAPSARPVPGGWKSLPSLEETLGTNWLNKLGVAVLVLGIAFFLAYELRTLGPAGKVLVGYVVSLVLLGGGIRAERHERYRILARAGIGGGWALLFFTTYAMSYVAAARVLSSQALDLALLVAVAVAMVAHTLKYRSQAVTGLAFLLAFLTFISVSYGHPSVLSLMAGVILAAALAAIALRMSWFELEVLGILAAYLNHFFWLRPIITAMGPHHHPFPEFTASAVLLIFYWLIFRGSYILRRIEPLKVEEAHFTATVRWREIVSTAAALLNPFLLLAVMWYQSVNPRLAFWFLLAVGAAETLFGRLAMARRRRLACVILSTLGVTLLVAAFPFRYSGARLSVLWLIEAEAFFVAGIALREVVFRRLATLAALLVAGHLLAVDAARVLGARMDGGYVVREPRLAVVFGVSALLFYASAHWAPRRWPDLATARLDLTGFQWISYTAALMLFVGAWIAWPGAWTAVAWSVIALALAIPGRTLRITAVLIQANLFAAAAVVRAVTTNLHATETYHHLTLRLITGSIIAALLYLFSRWSGRPEFIRTRRVPMAFTWAASFLVALVIWYELRPASVALGWAIFGLILFECGLAWRSVPLRFQAYAALASSSLRVLFVNLNAPDVPGQLSTRLYTMLPLSLAFYYIYGRLLGREDPFLAPDRRIRAPEYHSLLGTLVIVALMRFELDLDWVIAAWAALALILLAIAWRSGQRIFTRQAILVALAVLVRGILHNLYQRSYFPGSFWHGRGSSVGCTVALLMLALPLAFRLRQTSSGANSASRSRKVLRLLERRPEQVFFVVAFLLLTALLGVEARHGMVTLAWGLEAVTVFAFALWVGERSFRLAGLGLLLVSVVKIVVMDAWAMQARDRYITFIVLGCSLLLVSFLYTRYRETIRQYL